MGGTLSGSGAGLGGIGGLLSNQKEGATNAGNIYTGDNREFMGNVNTARTNASNAAGTQYSDLQNQVQNGGITGQLYGQGGALSQAIGGYKNLQDNPGLTAQDQTAYGQASGQIANAFGGQQNSIAQAMANRGMSNSGAAGAAFSNSFGNQQEQLAGLQTQIAQNREQLNTQRMGQLQQFITQMGAGANNSIGQAAGQNQNVYNNSMGYINSAQNQLNNQQAQMLGSQHSSTLSNTYNSALGGAIAQGDKEGAGAQQGLGAAMSMFA